VGCLWKRCHLGVNSAVCTTLFQNELNPPLGWLIQLVKKQLLNSEGLQAWEHRMFGFAGSGGKGKGERTSVV